jgi:CRP/FNR family cyclic AMP-dependent transcriptional regulator
MSISLTTSETSFVDFHPSIDLGAKARANHVLPAEEMVSTDASRGESFFPGLSESSIRAINQIAQVSTRPNGTMMFFEGDRATGVYLLYEGRANVLTANAEGKTLILKIALPGDVLGLNAVLAGTSHTATVQTVRPCRFAFIVREDFLKLVKEHSDACLYFAQRLSRDCHSAYDVIRSMCNPVSARLARFLISCCANRDVCEGTVRAKVVLTHETIAQHIGCSRETVCRTLSDFKRKGLAELVGTTLVVHDRAALECLNVS